MQQKLAFDEKLREHAIIIMQDISQHPCARPFIFPLYSNTEQVKNPICITIIINKLLNADKKYRTTEDWRSDVQLLYKNTLSHYGMNSNMSILAETFLNIFEKEYRKLLSHYYSSIWLEQFSYLIQKQKILEMQMPGKLGQNYRTLFTGSTKKPSQVLSMSKLNVFSCSNETVDQPNESQSQSQPQPQPQNNFNSRLLSIEKQKMDPGEEEYKPGKKFPSQRRRNFNQDPATSDKGKCEKASKNRNPRITRQARIEINPLIADEFQQSNPSFGKDTISNCGHDQNDKSSASADTSPASEFTTFQKSDDKSKQNFINQEDRLQSISTSSGFSLANISHVAPPTIAQNESLKSPTVSLINSKLPAAFEEKVEDIEEDVLYDVTSCFS